MWHDIQHGLFHFDKGVFYTSKQLFTRPGHTIREFIEGKRIKHFRPLSLVIILATIYGLLYHYFNINLVTEISGNAAKQRVSFDKINEWLANHFAWATLLTIPFSAIGSYLVFKKQGYNFIEHLVLNAFLASQRLLVHILTFPVIYFNQGTENLPTIAAMITLLDIVLIFWGYSQFFNKLSKGKALLLSLLSYLIFWIFMVFTSEILRFMFGYVLR